MSKKQNHFIKFFAKNTSVESTDLETGLPNAASLEISIQNTDKGSKAEKRKFQDVWKSFSWFVYESSHDVMCCDFFRKAGPDI
jgi:hypothetical protein